MQSHHIEVTKTARYVTHGEMTPKTKNVWFACHGYGQLAPYFIRKFEFLSPEEHFVVCPEAMSRFYSETVRGRVGATWMTKEDRLTEIKDYLGYLNALYAKIFEDAPVQPEQVRVKLLGFSQGSATVSRWAFDEHIKFDDLIIWAGSFAHDLDFEKSQQVLADKQVYFVYGKQDELIKPENFQEQEALIQKLQLQVNIITFDGKHELNHETLADLA